MAIIIDWIIVKEEPEDTVMENLLETESIGSEGLSFALLDGQID